MKSSEFPGFGKFPKIFAGNLFELDYFHIFLIFSISGLIFGSFYFIGNFWLPKFVVAQPETSSTVKIAQREPKNGYNFQTSAAGISGKIDTSLISSILLCCFDKPSLSFSDFSTN